MIHGEVHRHCLMHGLVAADWKHIKLHSIKYRANHDTSLQALLMLPSNGNQTLGYSSTRMDDLDQTQGFGIMSHFDKREW
jgi:hypothetical protein